MLTIVKLEDIPGAPKVKLDLPGPLRIGDPVNLPRLRLTRVTPEGRQEVLEVDSPSSRFRVVAVGIDSSFAPPRQLLSVQSAQPPIPTWRAVKKRPEGRQRLSPARSPRTPI